LDATFNATVMLLKPPECDLLAATASKESRIA